MGNERTRDHGIRETGLFWRALRAPEDTLASREFKGVLTEGAATVGSLYGGALAVVVFLVFSIGYIETLVSDGKVQQSGGGVLRVFSEYFPSVRSAVFFYATLMTHYGFGIAVLRSRFLRRRDPTRRERPTLTARTAIRYVNVLFARFLRRLVFPWEWYLGRP